MSKNTKKKKSTTKKKKLNTSRLIPIIAVIEALVLVGVTTFAWYFISQNRKLASGIITVQADSGLEIDFADADKNTYIDIKNYIDEETFFFEPATSVDGRNIYFPTTGTFNETNTSNMIFREGTVNDINSKYINIDFELTNNNNEEMAVYLSNNSKFKISGTSQNVSEAVNGKALRLAFYNNDGNSGKVDSSFAGKFKSSDTSDTGSQVGSDDVTVYFYKSTSNGWGDVKAYLYDSEESTVTETINNKSYTFNNSGYYKAWPGDICSHVSGNLYSYKFSNPYKTTTETINDVEKTVTSLSHRRYNTIMFTDGSDSHKTKKYSIANNHVYHDNLDTNSTGEEITLYTIYFLKPEDWAENPKCAVQDTSDDKWFGDTDAGDVMKKAGTGVYSFTFPSFYDKLKFIDNTSNNPKDPAETTTVANGNLYYFPATTVSGVNDGDLCSISDYDESKIYFYNSKNWKQPYANVNAFADAPTAYEYKLPMIDLTGGLYYVEVPSVFINEKMETRTDEVGNTTIADSGLANNCTVYFSGTNASGTDQTTEAILSKTNNIYTPGDPTGTANQFALTDKNYASQLDITENSYAVISPGVSAGFQRNANPVKEINNATGVPTNIIPTFASSFDDFIMGSATPVFRIGGKKTVHMSMIIWLEGTDEHCTGANYSAKNINLYLEFSTLLAKDANDETYTYRFTDATEELWTSNTVQNAAGVPVNPVMQLYDVDEERGYIMSGKTFSTYSGENKVVDWECNAPQSILSSKHKIEFRRVNPYNENEVWNRWQAGNITTFSKDSFDSATHTVTFTAFADGSPDYASYHNKEGFSAIPELSCGGLWGNFRTDKLYVYDGREKRNIEDKMTSDTGECGYLFCHYTYKYPISGEEVTIEYKGSSHYNAFFSFIVPADIYSQKPHITFPNYVSLSKYAMNAAEQTNIYSRNIYDAGTVAGHFYELNSANGGYEYDHSYWGSDVIYVQAKNTLGREYRNDWAFYQLHFYNDTSNPDSGTVFYSYLYENPNYLGSGVVTSFVAVVPNNTSYNYYRFEACKHDSHSTKIRIDMGHHSIVSSTDANTDLIYNTVASVNQDNDGRILTLDWDYVKIYYKNAWDDNSDYNGGEDGHWHVVMHWGNDGDQTYAMPYSHSDSNGKPFYYGFMPSNRDDLYFMFNKNSPSKRSTKNNSSGKDGCVFEPNAWNSTYSQVEMKSSGTSYDGNYDHNQLGTSLYNNGSWPEYVPPVSDGPSGS